MQVLPQIESHFSTDEMHVYVLSTFCKSRLDRGFHTISRETDINAEHDELCRWLSKRFVLFESKPTNTVGIGNDKDVAFRLTNRSWSTKVTFTGEPKVVEQMVKDINKEFDSNPCYIRWVYDPQYMDDMTMPINSEHQPVIEMYPFLDESLESYYERYLASSANILVLIGPPGTGKTTFIRGLLSHTKKSATLTYHEKVLQQDSFFVNWLESDDTYMILEDSDSLLLPRKDGNDMMARFLNMGDGLMGFKNKKIIFSTNLPHVSDIDEALTRPGRCFDILEFNRLNREQSKILCDVVGINLPDGDSFTVSELFASKKNEVKFKKKHTFGFV